jgi:hypothetical protein
MLAANACAFRTRIRQASGIVGYQNRTWRLGQNRLRRGAPLARRPDDEEITS